MQWRHTRIINDPELSPSGDNYIVVLEGHTIIIIPRQFLPRLGDMVSSCYVPSSETQSGWLLLARTLGEALVFDRRI